MAAGKRRNRGLILILLALIIIFGLVAVGVIILRNQIFSFQSQLGEELVQETVPVITPTPASKTVPIIVLAQPVQRGAVIQENMLATIDYPIQRMEEGLFLTNMQDVVGKKARYDLEARIPLTNNMLSASSDRSIAAFNIPVGKVAISIPADRYSLVSYALEPGDHVNVLASLLFIDLDPEFQTILPNLTTQVLSPMVTTYATTAAGEEALTTTGVTVLEVPLVLHVVPPQAYPMSYVGRTELDPNLPGIAPAEDEEARGSWMYVIPSEQNQRPRLVSQTLIQDAIVLWVGEYPTPEERAAAAQPQPQAAEVTPTTAVEPQAEPVVQETPDEQPVVRPNIITLIVDPQDAVTLNYLMIAGADLNLALRAAGDDSKISTEAVTLQFIMEQYNIPLPSKLPYGYQPRVDDFTKIEEMTNPTPTPAP